MGRCRSDGSVCVMRVCVCEVCVVCQVCELCVVCEVCGV